jgi:hypothetical protein
VGQPVLPDAVMQALKDAYDVHEAGCAECEAIPDGALVLSVKCGKAHKCLSSSPPAGEAGRGISPASTLPLPQPHPQGEGRNTAHPAAHHPHRRVWSESDFMRACPEVNGLDQSITVGVHDLVTPLAVDYAARMRITINRGDERQ